MGDNTLVLGTDYTYDSDTGVIVINRVSNTISITATAGIGIAKNDGTEIYFNPVTGLSCTSTEVVSTSGTKTGCMKWYVFNDVKGKATVNLLLDHNTTALVVWNSSGSNISGPSEVITQLWSDTDGWSNVLTRTDSYSVNNGTSTYTINYNGHKARLITGAEIAKITGDTSYAEATTTSDGWFYLDSHTQTQSTTCTSGNTTGCKYGWLYDRTSSDCTTYGCSNNSDGKSYGGYWTATSVYGANHIWYIAYTGGLGRDIPIADSIGIRPVITISKSLIY